MTTAISAKTRKKEVLERYSIKDNAYYARLKKLGIKPGKDSSGSYLTPEQIEKMDSLHEHIKENGTMEGFVFVRKEEAVNNNGDSTSSKVEENNPIIEEQNSSLVKAEGNQLAESANGNGQMVGEEQGVKVEVEVEVPDPLEQDFERVTRNAAEIKARRIVGEQLLTLELANQMNEEDLPDDLKEYVNNARSAADPKSVTSKVPAAAAAMLSKYRNSRGGKPALNQDQSLAI